MTKTHVQPAGHDGDTEGVQVVKAWCGIVQTRHPDELSALRRAIQEFERQGQSRAALRRITAAGHEDEAILCLARTGQKVVILGGSPLVDTVRELLPALGWQAVNLPTPGTPLRDVAHLLDPRLYNAVARYGYRTLEEIAAVSDAALLDIRGIGSRSLDALRGVVVAHLAMPATTHAVDETIILTGAASRELEELLGNLIDITVAQGNAAVARRATDMLTLLRQQPDASASPSSSTR